MEVRLWLLVALATASLVAAVHWIGERETADLIRALPWWPVVVLVVALVARDALEKRWK